MTENLEKYDQLMDILLVMDKEKKEIRAVKGIDENGELETVPAKKENKEAFLKFDKNGSMLKNFISNFMRQLKNPTRFDLFKIPVIRLESISKLLHKNMENPSESATKELEKYKVTPEVIKQQSQDLKDNGQQTLPQNEKDVFVVRDNLEKSITAHKGADFNKHPDVIEKYIHDFKLVFDNPEKDVSFFRIPADKYELLEKRISTEYENPTPSGITEIFSEMEKYKLNTENMGKNVKEENPQSQSTEKKNESGYRYDESKINWDQLKNFGITKEKLQETNALDSMLKGNKSPGMYPISMNFEGVILQTDARLSFRNDKNGDVVMAVHGIRQQPELDKPFFGHKFSEEDKQNLLTTGNMGRIAETRDFKTGEVTPSFISLDKQTNEIVAMKVEYLRIPEKIKGVELSEQQQELLAGGKAIRLDGMTSNAGKEFSATIQVNAERRGLEFIFDRQPKQAQENRQGQAKEQFQKQEQSQDEKKIFIKSEIGGQKITPKEQEDLRAGKTIYKEGILDKKGEMYNAYIKVDPGTNKLKFSSKNPDESKVIAPANENRTQVAANNQGKKTEENKHVNGPLKQGQNKPTEKQAEKQEQKQEQEKPKKSKGMGL